uniref:Lipoprotein n=1 Tax=viral metagenome TaxID=1070528 RepID=A0A6M3IW49_9ZZZZ
MLIRKFISVMLTVILVFGMMACGSTKVIEGVEYDTYGLINKNDNRNPDVKYKIIIGNIVWSIILVETIAAPIYFLGFSIYEPVRKKTTNEKKGQI